MLTCTRCKQVKCPDEFGNDKRIKSGKSIYCLECMRAASKAYRQANPDKARASCRKSWERGREKKNARTRERYREQRSKILAANKCRRQNDYANVLRIERQSRARHKDRYRPIKNARQNARNRVIGGKTFLITQKDLRRLYTQSCAECGSNRNQSIDHRIPLSRGGRHSIGNMMTLCRSCNSSKGARFLTEWRRAKNLVAA